MLFEVVGLVGDSLHFQLAAHPEATCNIAYQQEFVWIHW
jgi:hypothetical protein